MNLHRLFVRAPYSSRVDLAGRNVIVTGAAPRSLGFEAAAALTAWGAAVVLTTRSNTQAAVEALKTRLPDCASRISGHALDLSLPDSVARFGDWYAEGHNTLDALVNNAGVHMDLLSQWKEPQPAADGVEIHWRTNYLGTAHLTHKLLPLLRRTAAASGGARIVHVSSMLHQRGRNALLFAPQPRYNSWTAYGLSKLALIHHSFELQRRYAAEGVQAYCLHPGSVYTNIADKGLAGNPRIESMRKALAPIERLFLLTAEEGVQTHLYCATHPGAEGGRYYVKCREARPSTDALDTAVSARLWRETEAWLLQLP
jgi:NAD(P)-dependent dehydrogenase (short-subunit alcohol dehydrogenase family)